MTTDNVTELTEFETAGQPTSIDDLQRGSPDNVLDAFDDIESFATAVTINGRDTPLLVGRTVNGKRGIYHVYHQPTDPDNHAYAGVLGRRRYPEPAVVGFVPAGEDPDDETVAEPVTSIELTRRTEFDALDTVINHVKSDLTGHDWVDTGRADTTYTEWQDAVLALIRFYQDASDDASFTITQKFLKGATMHAIARYPSDASKLLSSASMRLDRLEDNENHNRYVISPFSLERLMLDYANANVDTDAVATRE